jgi:hypothetical protein
VNSAVARGAKALYFVRLVVVGMVVLGFLSTALLTRTFRIGAAILSHQRPLSHAMPMPRFL